MKKKRKKQAKKELLDSCHYFSHQSFLFLLSLLSLLCHNCCMLTVHNWILLFLSSLFLWDEKHQRKQFPICSSLSSPHFFFFYPALEQWNVNLFRAFGTEQKVIVGSPTVFAISCPSAGGLLSFWRIVLRDHETAQSWVLMSPLSLKCFCFPCHSHWEESTARATVNTSGKHTCHLSGFKLKNKTNMHRWKMQTLSMIFDYRILEWSF